jgi:penicillin-binding protein A
MVFVLFSILILRLGFIQIIKGEAYSAQAKETDVTTVSYSVPRGRIYDTKPANSLSTFFNEKDFYCMVC